MDVCYLRVLQVDNESRRNQLMRDMAQLRLQVSTLTTCHMRDVNVVSRSQSQDSFSSRSEWLDHAEVASTGFVFASVVVLSEGYRHDGPGVCLGDGQTEDEGVPSQGGRGDALLRRMPPYMTLTLFSSVNYFSFRIDLVFSLGFDV